MSFFNFSWLLLLLILFSILFNNKLLVSGQCLTDQRDLLLQLNQSLSSYSFSNPLYQSKRSSWSLNTDCCSAWAGVNCDKDGHVISLDLSREGLTDGLDNSSSLFKLQHLQNLNLAYNSFESRQIPSGFDRFANLTNLNMSKAGFSGQIPIEISRLTRLVSLDLSTYLNYPLTLDGPDLGTLIRNLSELRVLGLDGVNISAEGRKWCQAVSSSLPKLQVLSLCYCSLSGPIDKSLLQLRSLYEIRLDGNNISTQVPDLFVEFSNLTSLSLSSCGLNGKFPEKFLQLQTLQSLNVAGNQLLRGSLPEFPQNGSLQRLVLRNTSFSGEIPNSIGNLKLLSYLNLGYCSFNGSIPASMAKLDQLQFLDLAHNRLTGPIPPPIFQLSGLINLALSSNNLNGTYSLDMFQNFMNLSVLDLSYNNFSIDTHIANPTMFPQLTRLSLRSCNLSGFPDFLRNQSKLISLDLSSNQIRGRVPNWIWRINTLNLSKNCLEDLEQPLFDPIFNGSSYDSYMVDLSFNMLQGKNLPLQSTMILDYSNNNFTNVIPHNISSYIPGIISFSLSSNNLMGGIPTSICECNFLQALDLSNNKLSGPIPPCLGTMRYLSVLNLGGNYFHGTIPPMFPEGCRLETLSLNKNILVGNVARSLANCTMLQVLDLGNNQMNGTFPSWLGNMSNLRILILRSNRFHGTLRRRRTADQNFQMLQIIDISSNNFTGNLGSEFFSSFKAMMINNEDDNTIEENQILRFGWNLAKWYYVSVTVTHKGQKMELEKILTIYTSIDLSNNGFEGGIPEVLGSLSSLYFLNISQNALTGGIPPSFGNLKQLESLDLSQNKLSGEIPVQLAWLTFLSVLNLSYNHLVGKIPFGTQIQSFSATSFEGNDGLCGPPLIKKCIDQGTEPPRISPSEFNWMPVSVASGFGVGIGISVCLTTFWGTRVRKSSRH